MGSGGGRPCPIGPRLRGRLDKIDKYSEFNLLPVHEQQSWYKLQRWYHFRGERRLTMEDLMRTENEENNLVMQQVRMKRMQDVLRGSLT